MNNLNLTRRLLFVMALVLMALALVACDASGSTTGSGDATVVIENETGGDLCKVYVSPSSEDNWTDERLGIQRLSDGGTLTVRVEPGQWDFRAEPCGDGEPVEEYQTDIEDTHTWTVGG